MKRFADSHKWLRIGALTSAAVVLCLAGSASAGADGRGCKGGDKIERRVRAMDLDEETRAAVYAVLDKARSARRSQKDELHGERERMRELLEADAPEEATVLAQAERIGGLETGLQQERLKTMLTIRGMVGPEAWGKAHDRHKRRGRGGSLR